MYSALRMQHYVIFLQGFNYTIKYRNSKEHSNADCLSRLPIPEVKIKKDVVEAFQTDELQEFPVNAKLIEYKTANLKLKKLLHALQTGNMVPSEDRFNLDRTEFNIQNDIIRRGFRVVIPSSLHMEILKQLHIGHFGINKMKSITRGY